MTELEAMQHQRDDTRAQLEQSERDLKRVCEERDVEITRLRGLLDAENAQTLKYQNALARAEERVTAYGQEIANLKHQLAVEKGRPGHDSYRDDLLRVTCAVAQTNVCENETEIIAASIVLLDKVYAVAKARKETKP